MPSTPHVVLLTALQGMFAGPAAVAQRAEEGVAGERPPSASERIELHGFVDLYRAWNRNAPADGANFYPGYGNSAKREGELGVNLAGLDLSTKPEPIGFRLTLAAGNEMEMLKSGEPEGEATSRDAFRYVYQATVSWATGVGRGLMVEGGLYPSHIGFESPLPRDNWNYTQGWVGNLTPSYQTGLKASYPFTDRLSGQLHVVNGWQITADNNDRSSFGAQLAWTPATGRMGSIVLNTWYGPELAGDDDDVRTLLDLIATVKATDRLQVAFEGVSGRQERPAALGGGSDEWTILAAWARLAIGGRWGIAIRAERVEDEAGAISGFTQTLEEGTLTFEFRPRPELALKLEGRLDRSDAAVFTTESEQAAREQRLVVAAAILTF